MSSAQAQRRVPTVASLVANEAVRLVSNQCHGRPTHILTAYAVIDGVVHVPEFPGRGAATPEALTVAEDEDDEVVEEEECPSDDS